MDIILLENLEKVGRKYEIVKVKDGFGRNYLIPQGIGIVANRQNLGKLTGIKRQIAAKDNQMLGVYQGFAAKLVGQSLVFVAKSGKSGRLFGSITAQMVADKLKALGVELDRRRIIMPAEVKELGSYTATLDLHASLDVKIPFEVKSEEQVADEVRNRPNQITTESVAAEAAAVAAAAVAVEVAPAVEEIMESAPAPVADVVEEVVAAPVIVEEVGEIMVEEVAAAAPVAEAAEEVIEIVEETTSPAVEAAAEEVVELASETAENLESAADEVAETLESAPLVEEVSTVVEEAVEPAADNNYKEEEA